MTTVLVTGGVILLAMIGVSWYGWVTLPADARVPVHFGTGYNNFVPKRLGLIMHPAAGALVYVISALATRHPGKSAPAFILPLVMCLLLAVQVGAIKVARSRSGAGQLEPGRTDFWASRRDLGMGPLAAEPVIYVSSGASRRPGTLRP